MVILCTSQCCCIKEDAVCAGLCKLYASHVSHESLGMSNANSNDRWEVDSGVSAAHRECTEEDNLLPVTMAWGLLGLDALCPVLSLLSKAPAQSRDPVKGNIY